MKILFAIFAVSSSISLSKLLLGNFKDESDGIGIEHLVAGLIPTELRDMFDTVRQNKTRSFLEMINPSRNRETTFNIGNINLIQSMILLDMRDSELDTDFLDDLLANPEAYRRRNPTLTILKAYDDDTEQLDYNAIYLLLDFIQNECPTKFESRMQFATPLLMELENDSLRRMLLILLIESFSTGRLIDNDVVIEAAFSSNSGENRVIEDILIDQLMALVGRPDGATAHDELLKLGPLLQLAKMPCERDNQICHSFVKLISMVALARHDEITGHKVYRLMSVGKNRLEKYDSMLNQFNNTCGEEFELTTVAPTLDPRERFQEMKEKLAETAANSLSEAKMMAEQQFELFKKSANPTIKPIPNDLDYEQLENTFSQMKVLMEEYGIEPDESFKELERKVDDYVDFGSGMF